jgi:phage anti-repressor protein
VFGVLKSIYGLGFNDSSKVDFKNWIEDQQIQCHPDDFDQFFEPGEDLKELFDEFKKEENVVLVEAKLFKVNVGKTEEERVVEKREKRHTKKRYRSKCEEQLRINAPLQLADCGTKYDSFNLECV